jgi:transcriptional regulator GlxA family with amidase domain
MTVAGPLEVFAEANFLAGSCTPYEMKVISSTDDRIVVSQQQLPLVADETFLESRESFDTILVAGGTGAMHTRHDRRFLEWLKERCASARRYGSVCGGAFLLAQVGLLDGQDATTHWEFCEELARLHPKVRVDPRPVFIKSGRCYTAAGITTGLDLSMALVEEDLGSDIALSIAKKLALFLKRPAGQSQVSVTLTSQAQEVSALAEVLPWIADSLQSSLSVSCMAEKAAMSPRNFTRVFLRETGKTPSQYLTDLRVETAKRLLETTDYGLEAIADRCGLGSAEILRRTFHRQLRMTPSACRKRLAQDRESLVMAPR